MRVPVERDGGLLKKKIPGHRAQVSNVLPWWMEDMGRMDQFDPGILAPERKRPQPLAVLSGKLFTGPEYGCFNFTSKNRQALAVDHQVIMISSYAWDISGADDFEALAGVRPIADDVPAA